MRPLPRANATHITAENAPDKVESRKLSSKRAESKTMSTGHSLFVKHSRPRNSQSLHQFWGRKMSILIQRIFFHKAFAIVFISIISNSISEGVSARETITWADVNFPPAYFVDGPRKNKGFIQKARQYYIDQMPEYDHNFVTMSSNRILRTMKTTDGFCYSSHIKTSERMEVMHFSRETVWVQAFRLIFLEKNKNLFLNYINDEKEVSINSIILDQNLTAGFLSKRSYTPKIDEAIGNLRIQGNYEEFHNQSLIHPMLSAGRIDWTIGYPYEMTYYFSELNLPGKFLSYGIDGIQGVIAGHISCSKTPLGAEIIQKVNRIRGAAGNPPQYVLHYKDWVNDETYTEFFENVRARIIEEEGVKEPIN